MPVDDPLDTSDMETARHHLRRLLTDWRDAGGPVDSLVMFIEGFVACKVSEMMTQREAYLAQETRTCHKHGPHSPGACPQCDELAEARSIVATIPTYPPGFAVPFTHWNKDPLIPYTGCDCSSCEDARKPIETTVSDGTG